MAAHTSCRFLLGLIFCKPSLVCHDLPWKSLYHIALLVLVCGSASLMSAWHQEDALAEAVSAQLNVFILTSTVECIFKAYLSLTVRISPGGLVSSF